ncbi:MAG: MFS transporter [Proteobacteria bacterium]|nr:MFS transporter [Pseudomonadota bacterium]
MSGSASPELSTVERYLRLAVLVVAAGAIYPLIYLRQNFELTILESFAITAGQLSRCYAILGVLFMLTYVPSGWLADRVAPRLLMSFSLALAGILGVWFSTMPSFGSLQIIFAGWGLATGLTFWAALIKATAMLAQRDEQGRFFGILEGGRGLVEAILASIAVALFGYWTTSRGSSPSAALYGVIWLYVSVMLILAPLVFFVVKPNEEDNVLEQANESAASFVADLKMVLGKTEVWLVAICILTGYQLFWATYSLSGYMQTHYGLTAVAVGWITVAKLWMRAVGPAVAGFAGDFLNLEGLLGVLLLLASIALMALVFLPATAGTAALLAIVLAIGVLTYAVKGIYWATLASCNISNRVKGLAIGVISLLAYSPDVYLPLLNEALRGGYPGKLGYGIYFSLIAIMGVLGALAAWRLGRHVAGKKIPA